NYFKNQQIKNPQSAIANLPAGRQGLQSNALLFMHFQKDVEQKAYEAGGGKLMAPAQRMVDFCNNKISSTLPECSYLPGVHSADLKKVLPAFIHTALQRSFKIFGNKMAGRYNGRG